MMVFLLKSLNLHSQYPIKVLVNKSIDQSVFPEKLKATRYPSFLKRIIVLIKVITTLSMSCQRFLNFIISVLCFQHTLYRSGCGCQMALFRIKEDWKKALDDTKFIASILVDLSKAFDCLISHTVLPSFYKWYFEWVKILSQWTVNEFSFMVLTKQNIRYIFILNEHKSKRQTAYIKFI